MRYNARLLIATLILLVSAGACSADSAVYEPYVRADIPVVWATVAQGSRYYLTPSFTNVCYDPSITVVFGAGGACECLPTPLPIMGVALDDFLYTHGGNSVSYPTFQVDFPVDKGNGEWRFRLWATVLVEKDVDGTIYRLDGSGHWHLGDGCIQAPPVEFIVTVVPEPSSIAAILLGLAGIAGTALRRRN